jgi:hypothetical protein
MANRCVGGFTPVINPFSSSEQHDPQQASDLIALVVLALVLANIVPLMALSS